MHELSIVSYVVKQVEKIARANAVTKVGSVTLEFGEVSGVVPELIEDCWKWYVRRTPLMEGAELISETVPAVTYCEGCSTTYPTVKYGRTCPRCGSGRTYLTQGREISIKQIEAC